jgi:hypothetical protein
VLAQSTEIPTLQKRFRDSSYDRVSRFHRSIEAKLKKLQFESLLLSDLEAIPHVQVQLQKSVADQQQLIRRLFMEDFKSA